MPQGRPQVTRIDATDPDGGPLSLTIAGGADTALSTIDPATGDLASLVPADHEEPADAGRDGSAGRRSDRFR